jgi:hypothetical protein
MAPGGAFGDLSRSDGVISPACRRYIDPLVNEISKGGKYGYDTVEYGLGEGAITSTRRCRTVPGPSPSRPSTNPLETSPVCKRRSTIGLMARKPNPARIYKARRAAIEARLTGAGMLQDESERWLAAWEGAGGRGGSRRAGSGLLAARFRLD